MARGQPQGAPPARERVRVPLLLKRPAPLDQSGPSLGQLLVGRWPGRLLLGALALKGVIWVIEALAGTSDILDGLDTLVRVLMLVSLGYFVWQLFGFTRRRFLWRVRRRLFISYIFIGVIPALLLIAFFLFAAVLLFFNVSGYLFKTGVDDIVDEAQVAAQTAADEIARSQGLRSVREILERRYENNQTRYPGLSLAFIERTVPARAAGAAADAGADPAAPPPPALVREKAREKAALAVTPVIAGEWQHMDPPKTVPAWVSAGGFGGLVAYVPPDAKEEVHLVVRAVGFASGSRDPRYGVIVDIPIDEPVLEQLHQTTGIEPGAVSVVRETNQPVQPILGRLRTDEAPIVRQLQTGAGAKYLLKWLVFLDFKDWDTGRNGSVSMSIRVGVRDIYQRISSAQSLLYNRTIGELTLLVLGFIAVLFLIIEFAAFFMGLTLARSITRSVHALFHGTERVRFGDFAHRIEVRDRDQLGELAESFNAMTANIEDLLQQAQEKRRLEEELRIAREIQMSLLPRGAMQMPGLGCTALCVPAREVGGDYYDFFKLGERRVGVLIADVAGKGTSAALYMAELKGLVLSLSKIYDSPRQLLIEVNSILSDNLDRRSFITMTYAIFDLERRTLTYARAGHTPLIHLPCNNGSRRTARILVPNGMVVGLNIEGFETHFETLLEELSIPLECGDVFVLFTDGITEAMNADSDLFGDDRLTDIVEEHADMSCEELRERILREVDAFVGDADPHDDMTMILLKVEETPAS
jgi:serine phosphatase RsbU (regulator of sigma subunit)